jgi:hypothetical protein
MYEWALSRSSDPEISVTAIMATENVVSETEQARQGSREFIILGDVSEKILLVRDDGLMGRIAAFAWPL